MRKYISTLSLLLFLGFLVYNISHNGPIITSPSPLEALPCGHCGGPGPVSAPAIVTSSFATMSASVSSSSSSANLSGEIVSTGGADATTVGFNYGLTTDYGKTVSQDGTFGVGTFSNTITSLTCSKTYHFRAFATNTGGTGAGTDQSFNTNSCGHAGGRITSSSSSSSASSSVAVTPVVPSAAVCAEGDKFSTATGLPCTSLNNVPTVCPVGDLFSTSTGLPCTSFVPRTSCPVGDKFSTTTGLPCTAFFSTPIH